MKNLLLALILSVPSIALSAKNDGWCDVQKGKTILACTSPYWTTSGQYYINNKMYKSMEDVLDNTFIDCWKMETRGKVIRRVGYKNFRVGQRDWSLYELNHNGKQAFVWTGACS